MGKATILEPAEPREEVAAALDLWAHRVVGARSYAEFAALCIEKGKAPAPRLTRIGVAHDGDGEVIATNVDAAGAELGWRVEMDYVAISAGRGARLARRSLSRSEAALAKAAARR